MWIKSNIVGAFALLLAPAAAVMAAPKHSHHHKAPAPAAYGSFGAMPGAAIRREHGGSVICPGSVCDPYNHQQVKCIGGSCSPEWGLDAY